MNKNNILIANDTEFGESFTSPYNTKKYKSGERIYNINSNSNNAYIILHGEVETKGTKNNDSLTSKRIFKKGAVIGLVDMIIDRNYSRTALTKTTTILAIISKEQTHNTFSKQNDISSLLLKGLVISIDNNNPGYWS